MLVVVSVSAWSAATTFLELLLVDKVFGLRVSRENELLGADYVEHGVAENDFTLQGIYDEKENGSEQLKSVEVNVINDLPITLAIDTFQNNDNGHKSFWKSVPVKRKIFRRNWLRKAVSIKGSRNEIPRNGTFTVQLSYFNGGQNVVDSNGATESRDHIRVVENGGVITDTESHLQGS